jgi:hypothetical protein
MPRDESYIGKRMMSMNIDGRLCRDRPKKGCTDCVKDDMRIKGVNIWTTNDKREWNKKKYTDPT